MRGRCHGLTLNQLDVKINMPSADIKKTANRNFKLPNHVPSIDSVRNRKHDIRQRKTIMIKGNDNLTS